MLGLGLRIWNKQPQAITLRGLANDMSRSRGPKYPHLLCVILFALLLSGWPAIGFAASSCSCPSTDCGSGATNSCKVECQDGERAQCDCDAHCSTAGAPVGSNDCECVGSES